jgi:hypothetical protein
MSNKQLTYPHHSWGFFCLPDPMIMKKHSNVTSTLILITEGASAIAQSPDSQFIMVKKTKPKKRKKSRENFSKFLHSFSIAFPNKNFL